MSRRDPSLFESSGRRRELGRITRYDGFMAPARNPRSDSYAARFEADQQGFIELVESLDDEQWQRVGKNFPQRMNDEDEGRPVGVIAHHVASSQDRLIERIEATVRGAVPPPIDIRANNASHAEQHADASRDEVLQLLRHNKTAITERIRSLPDDKLDVTQDSAAGPLSVAQRLERVLIGHIAMHRGSIEAAIS